VSGGVVVGIMKNDIIKLVPELEKFSILDVLSLRKFLYAPSSSLYKTLVPFFSIDVKLGNICNLSCRICNPFNSSSLITEQLQGMSHRQKQQHPLYKLSNDTQWIRKENNFWEELKTHLPNLKFLIIAGGEPLMIPEHLQILKVAIEQRYSNNIEIRYNTNGTKYLPECFALRSNFKRVKLLFSIDDIKDRFEYQRHGAVWDDVITNTRNYREFGNKNIITEVCCTVNIQNVSYLPEFYEWYKNEKFTDVYFNILFTPHQLSITQLTPAAKKLALEKLEAYHFGRHQSQIDKVIRFIKNSPADEKYSLSFQYYMSPFDKLRNQKFRDVHPEIAEAMEYHD